MLCAVVPGAQFGVYKPDTFWLDEPRPLAQFRRDLTRARRVEADIDLQ